MARLPQTKFDYQKLIEATEKFYPVELMGEGYRGYLVRSWAIPELDLSWKNSLDFFNYITELTGKNTPKEVYNELLAREQKAPEAISSQEKEIEETVPDKEKREAQEREREEREVARLTAQKQAKEDIERFVKTQEKIAQDTLNQKELQKEIYIEPVGKIKEPPLSDEGVEEVAILFQNAANDPEHFVEEISKEIETRLPEEIKASLTPEEVEFIAKSTSSDILERVVSTQNVSFADDKLFTPLTDAQNLKNIDSPELKEVITRATQDLIEQKGTALKETASLASLVLKKEVVNYLYNSPAAEFKVVDSPTSNTVTITPSLIFEEHKNLGEALTIKEGPKDEFLEFVRAEQSRFFQSVKSQSEYFKNIPQPGSPTSSVFVEREVGLSSFRESFSSKVNFRPVTNFAFGKFKGWAKSKIASKVGQTAVGKAVKGAIQKGLGTLAKKGAQVAAGEAVGAAAGTAVAPGVGTAIGFVIGWISSKAGGLVSKIKRFIKDNPWVLFAPFVAGGLIFNIPLLTLGSLLGAGIMAAGGLGSFAASAGGAILTFFSAVLIPSVAGPIIFSIFLIPTLVILMLFIINSGAYVVPPSSSLLAGVIESPYIGVTKTVEGSDTFENTNLPVTVTYNIEVRAKKGTLNNIRFNYSCDVVKDGSSPSCPPTNIPDPPSIISPTESFTFSYTHTYDASFSDALVIDTFTVTADAPDKAGTEAAGSASVRIGNPPEECPSSWPGSGTLTQGANGPFSHRGAEAIDISMVTGNSIRATHTGVVTAFGTDAGPYGKHVEVQSTCDDKVFFSRYAHLSVVTVKTGQTVTLGSEVGLSGSTGNSTGPHLHYEFRYPTGPTHYSDNPPYMMPIYIPKPLPRNCSSGYPLNDCGGTSIP